MIRHSEISPSAFRKQFKQKTIRLGGNRKLKIYGSLHCSSGKHMKTENRIFFTYEKEAVKQGYRPCGNCMKKAYQQWKNGAI